MGVFTSRVFSSAVFGCSGLGHPFSGRCLLQCGINCEKPLARRDGIPECTLYRTFTDDPFDKNPPARRSAVRSARVFCCAHYRQQLTYQPRHIATTTLAVSCLSSGCCLSNPWWPVTVTFTQSSGQYLQRLRPSGGRAPHCMTLEETA